MDCWMLWDAELLIDVWESMVFIEFRKLVELSENDGGSDSEE